MHHNGLSKTGEHIDEKNAKLFIEHGFLGLGSLRPIFSPLQEEELKQHLLNQEEELHGLGSTQARVLATIAADKNNICYPHPNGTLSESWLNGFRKRNPVLVLRRPESVSIHRAKGFNSAVVNDYFNLLEEQITLSDVIGISTGPRFSPNRIYNVDETSFSVNPKTQEKIFSAKGKKRVGQLVTSDRGKTVTAVLCVSASGQKLPVQFIFARKKMQNKLLDGTPSGTWGSVSEKGWMNLELFSQWFEWFVDYTKPTEEEPVLLVLDGHSSHTRNMSVFNYARSHYVTIICLRCGDTALIDSSHWTLVS